MNLRKNLTRFSKLTMAAAIAIPALMVSVPSLAADQTGTSSAKVKLIVGSSVVDPVDPLDPTTPIDPEDPDGPGKGGDIDPTPVVEGLSLNYVSNIDFGENDIVAGETTYYATNIKSKSPYVQITDNRGAGVEWHLGLKASKFTDGTVDSLAGAKFKFENPTSVAANGLTGVPAPTAVSTVDLNTDGTEVNLASATSGEGRGTWLVRWLDNGVDLTDTGAGTEMDVLVNGSTEKQFRNKNVSLTLPAGVGTVGDHTSTLTWTLSDTPRP